MRDLPQNYVERVYAGILGKIIGVYLGRPFEGWPHARIVRELGEIQYYVHERLGKPLIVTDDDISGTFTFLRAMSDYGNSLELTPAQIGQTWLNYLIEGKTVLWWGGMGNSTEHTAYLRLKAGVPAPESGSMALNGPVVAEQIGAQIFIDGWAMIAPGDPVQAAELARRAASVSHDGEAVYAAQLLAAMESQAFLERDVHRLLDTGLSMLPADCLIRRLVDDLRDWRAKYEDWHVCLDLIFTHYGYDKYSGNCHVVPNHALVIMALLYGGDDFRRALSIVNTAGWDTDCNSGNVGCLMGIKEGLSGIDAGPDFRGPVADRLYLPTADGGRTVTDAVHEAYEVVRMGASLRGQAMTLPKGGARFHFSLPGAVQGFALEDSPECRDVAWLENVPDHGSSGTRSLAVRYKGLATGRAIRVVRETLPAYSPTRGYGVVGCPTLYPGQMLRARLVADPANSCPVQVDLFVRAYGKGDALLIRRGDSLPLAPGQSETVEWQVSVPTGCPIAWVGVEVTSPARADGTLYLDWLTWDGVPTMRLDPPAHEGERWLQAWVSAVSSFGAGHDHAYRLIQNEGVGMIIQGTREWQNYAVSARLTPHLARSVGLVVRAQGLRRYYALRLTREGRAQLVRELDGTAVLAEAPCDWGLYREYALRLEVTGDHLFAYVNSDLVLRASDDALGAGAIGVLIEEGRLGVDDVFVQPVA